MSGEESFAYTPGLLITPRTYIKKVRALPLKGEILVSKGDKVSFDTIVGRCYLEGAPHVVKVAEILGVEPEDVPKYMVKKIGERVEKSEPIAKLSAFLGLIKRVAESPVSGVIESINEVTGHVVVREPPRVIEVTAYIRGTVVDVAPGEYAVIGTPAAYVQGIIGFSGERHGVIEVVVSRPDEVVDERKISEAHAGKIVVGGSMITYEALVKAAKVGVRGIVVGGAKITDLERILGYRIGVAITGREQLPYTIVLTEGFGKLPMSERAFKIFKDHEGEEAAINGATQVRAGVIRPEVIIPLKEEMKPEEAVESIGEGRMKVGSVVRIIRYPYFGAIGTVVELPIELQRIETESPVRVVKVRLEDGRVVVVPRANVEIISE